MTRQLDEDDVRVRPGRGKSRPRTKSRPAHGEATPGFVTMVNRGRYDVRLEGRARSGSDVTAVAARELGRKAIVVGDRVSVVGDRTAHDDSLARIVGIDARRTALRRSADDTDTTERIIVANADQLVIVAAIADPEPRQRLIDRCLVAAFDAGMHPILAVTKTDLADPAGLIAAYAALDVDICTLRRTAEGFDGVPGVADLLAGHVSALVGASGVGKSTLVNALVPGAARDTGRVNTVTGRGRHTSSSAVALALPDGWVIDTPGIRSFGLAHVTAENLLSAFGDLRDGTTGCPRGCTHDESDCALDQWVADGHAGANGAARLDSLRRLLRAIRDDDN